MLQNLNTISIDTSKRMKYNIISINKEVEKVKQVNLRIWAETHKEIKILAAKNGLTIMEMTQKLVDYYKKGDKECKS